MRASALAIAAALALAAVAPARAWDNKGHMATGAIAYDVLVREDPRLVAEIATLMAHHPDGARFERELAGTSGAARERLMFEYMARWPDDVGGTPADHADWHYAVKLVTPWGWLFPAVIGKAQSVLDREARIAADPRAPAADRAVALCWVFHIVGDMQQPLHAAYWVDGRFWHSDRAGTRGYVRARPGAAPIELHNFWDQSADQRGSEVAAADAIARALEAQHPRDPRTLGPAAPPRAAFAVWTQEDRKLAREVAYRNFRESPRMADAPVVDPAYAARARQVAEARVALGGYRLAAFLRVEMDRPGPRG